MKQDEAPVTADATAEAKVEDTKDFDDKKKAYSVGQKFLYTDSEKNSSIVEVVSVHLDDELVPFYDIRMEGGKVKQTDNAHLSALPSTEAEANVESTKNTNQTEGTDEEEGEVKEDKTEPVKEAGETQEPPAAPVPVSAPAPTEASVPVPVSAPAPASTLPPGVPDGVPMGVPAALPVQQTNTQPEPSQAVSETVVETQDIASHLVGRIIGKGGEQIRDIQARADCKVDVDQNVPHGAPKIITYQGPREKVDFAKSLVSMLCQDNWKNITLPIGFAKQKLLHVPSTVIGKIIGRGGEMIKVCFIATVILGHGLLKKLANFFLF